MEITGNPDARASIIEFESPSLCDEMTYISAARYQVATLLTLTRQMDTACQIWRLSLGLNLVTLGPIPYQRQ